MPSDSIPPCNTAVNLNLPRISAHVYRVAMLLPGVGFEYIKLLGGNSPQDAVQRYLHSYSGPIGGIPAVCDIDDDPLTYFFPTDSSSGC